MTLEHEYRKFDRRANINLSSIPLKKNDGNLHNMINPGRNLASGNYLVRVIAQDKFYTQRLIIQQ